ncbi:MAG: hypothetical protein AB1767_02660 [Bacillota bacterium]
MKPAWAGWPRSSVSTLTLPMADVAYNSALVDPYGRILELAVTPAGEKLILVADLPWAAAKQSTRSWEAGWVGSAWPALFSSPSSCPSPGGANQRQITERAGHVQ